jgi:hypothetical protein
MPRARVRLAHAAVCVPRQQALSTSPQRGAEAQQRLEQQPHVCCVCASAPCELVAAGTCARVPCWRRACVCVWCFAMVTCPGACSHGKRVTCHDASVVADVRPNASEGSKRPTRHCRAVHRFLVCLSLAWCARMSAPAPGRAASAGRVFLSSARQHTHHTCRCAPAHAACAGHHCVVLHPQHLCVARWRSPWTTAAVAVSLLCCVKAWCGACQHRMQADASATRLACSRLCARLCAAC